MVIPECQSLRSLLCFEFLVRWLSFCRFLSGKMTKQCLSLETKIHRKKWIRINKMAGKHDSLMHQILESNMLLTLRCYGVVFCGVCWSYKKWKSWVSRLHPTEAEYLLVISHFLGRKRQFCCIKKRPDVFSCDVKLQDHQTWNQILPCVGPVDLCLVIPYCNWGSVGLTGVLSQLQLGLPISVSWIFYFTILSLPLHFSQPFIKVFPPMLMSVMSLSSSAVVPEWFLGHKGRCGCFWESTWRIIPVSRWLETMISRVVPLPNG